MQIDGFLAHRMTNLLGGKYNASLQFIAGSVGLVKKSKKASDAILPLLWHASLLKVIEED